MDGHRNLPIAVYTGFSFFLHSVGRMITVTRGLQALINEGTGPEWMIDNQNSAAHRLMFRPTKQTTSWDYIRKEQSTLGSTLNHKKRQSDGKSFLNSQLYMIQVYSFIQSTPDAKLELEQSRFRGGRLPIHLLSQIPTILFNGLSDSSNRNFQTVFVHPSKARWIARVFNNLDQNWLTGTRQCSGHK